MGTALERLADEPESVEVDKVIQDMQLVEIPSNMSLDSMASKADDFPAKSIGQKVPDEPNNEYDSSSLTEMAPTKDKLPDAYNKIVEDGTKTADAYNSGVLPKNDDAISYDNSVAGSYKPDSDGCIPGSRYESCSTCYH